MTQRYNMPYRRQKTISYFIVLFRQNVEHNNIVDNFEIYDRNETIEVKKLLINVHGLFLDKFDFHDLSRKLYNIYVVKICTITKGERKHDKPA